MKKIAISLVVLAGFALPAHAQIWGDSNPYVQEEKAKKRDAEEADRQYKKVLQFERKGAKSTAAANDPWADVRGAEQPKAKR